MIASPPLFVDDRAGSKDLMKYEPVRTIGELCRLDSGDAMICGSGPGDASVLIGVEVKSIFDLISSMNTGRLQDTQLPALLSTYDIAWVLIYGNYRPGARGQLEIRGGGTWRPFKLGAREVPYGYVEGFLLDLAATGVHVRHSYNASEAAQWLGVLHRWWSKPWSMHKGLRALDRSREVSLMPGMDAGTHQRARIAAQLPGVGFERAVAAAAHFASVSDMVNADAAEWARVSGVGKVIAKAVVAAIVSR